MNHEVFDDELVKVGAEFNKLDNEAIASPPTAEMRQTLAAAGVSLPEGDELTALSRLFNTVLEASYARSQTASLNKAQGHGSWFNLFREIDEDGSGVITFDELQYATYRKDKLAMKKAQLPVETLQALWCALDVDDSDTIKADEFARFLKLAPVDHSQEAIFGGQMFNKGQTFSDFTRDAAIEATPTARMRVELQEAGVELPAEEELAALSKTFYDGLEHHRFSSGVKNQGTITWHTLFSMMDEDGSGFVTFDELEDVMRRTLKQGPSVVSENQLKALWCVLDADDSNQVVSNEFVRFLKLYTPPKQATKFGGQMFHKGQAFSDFTRDVAFEATPTAQMRAELQEAGVLLVADDELLSLSKLFYEGLEAVRIEVGTKNQGNVTWHNLFTQIDDDGSGFITYDELTVVVRKTLKKGPKVIPDERLKALWCLLDADDSNQIQASEMRGFLETYKPPKKGAKFGGQMFHKGQTFSDFTRDVAFEATPTAQMRAELQEAGVELPAGPALVALARQFHEGLEVARRSGVNMGSKQANSANQMFHLFKEMDIDDSGDVTYDEVVKVTRKRLGLKKKQLPENTLKALWCVLDADDSNKVMINELFKFLKLYTPPKSNKAKFGGQFSRGQMHGHDADLYNDNLHAAHDRPLTLAMRAQLQEAGVELPDAAELTNLSKLFNDRLEMARHKIGAAKSRDTAATREAITEFNLFAEMDVDGNGFVTFDELAFMTRKRLELKKTELKEDQLKALWCVLDADNTNAIEVDEFARFLKGQVESLLEEGRRRAVPPPGVVGRPLPPALRMMKPKERVFDFDEYLRTSTVAHEKRLKLLDARLRSRREKEKMMAQESARKIRAGQLNDARRRQLLSEMRGRARSPIPSDNNGRLAAGRVLTLYDSERLLALAETESLSVPSPPRALTSSSVLSSASAIRNAPPFSAPWPGRRPNSVLSSPRAGGLSPLPTASGRNSPNASTAGSPDRDTKTPLLDQLLKDVTRGSAASPTRLHLEAGQPVAFSDDGPRQQRPPWQDPSQKDRPLRSTSHASLYRMQPEPRTEIKKPRASRPSDLAMSYRGADVSLPHRALGSTSRERTSTPLNMALSRMEVGLLLKADDAHGLLSEEQVQRLSAADQAARAQLRSTTSLPALLPAKTSP